LRVYYAIKRGVVMQEKPYLTAEEVAELLSVSVDTVRNWCSRKKNKLPAFKIGREWRIIREDLERFIQERKNTQDD
jgi:putative molybdopterin biosynthesis protein